jgi:hypothetical protein
LSEPSEEEAVNLKPLLLKKFVWDIFPHEADIPAVLLSLGLVPDGEEGQAVEHAASDARLTKVAPMFKAVEILSGVMAEAMTAYLMHLLEKNGRDLADLPEEFREIMTGQNTEVIFQSTIAMIAHMMDYEVLTYTEELMSR